MTQELKQLSEWVKREDVTMTTKRVDSNPNMDDSGNMDHWRCKLVRNGKILGITFSMGRGHNGKPPKVEDVLDCLASDYTTEATSFEDWASEYGYDTDSRKAERTFKACLRQSDDLRDWLNGDEALVEELVYHTERL